MDSAGKTQDLDEKRCRRGALNHHRSSMWTDEDDPFAIARFAINTI